jgi:hypothetical protein
MILPEYDFDKFLKAMAGMEYYEILVKADQKCGTAERRSYGVRGAPKQRQMGSTHYAHQIKEFLYFMRYGSKPAGVAEWDFKAYKPVCEALVKSGQFKPTVLDQFK